MSDLVRVARTQAAVLSHTFGDEDVVITPSAVAVSIVDTAGVVVASGAAVADGTAWTFPLGGQALLGDLTVTWTGTVGAAEVVDTTGVVVVGAHLFTIAELRAADLQELGDHSKYPTARLVEVRDEVTAEVEDICDRAFVPRYGRAVLDGTGLAEVGLTGVRSSDFRRLRAVGVAPAYGQPGVPLTPTELAAVAWTSDGQLIRTDSRVWTAGRGNLVPEFEYGLDRPPVDLRRMVIRRAVYWAKGERRKLSARAKSANTGDGTTVQLDTAEAYRTGLPDVDAIYQRYSLRVQGGGDDDGGGTEYRPVSRLLSYDPQYDSLFHGGVR